jgi:hypothetical protein
MTKTRKSNKESRKPPRLNAKEKKAAKQVRKHAHDVVPFLPPHPVS